MSVTTNHRRFELSPYTTPEDGGRHMQQHCDILGELVTESGFHQRLHQEMYGRIHDLDARVKQGKEAREQHTRYHENQAANFHALRGEISGVIRQQAQDRDVVTKLAEQISGRLDKIEKAGREAMLFERYVRGFLGGIDDRLRNIERRLDLPSPNTAGNAIMESGGVPSQFDYPAGGATAPREAYGYSDSVVSKTRGAPSPSNLAWMERSELRSQIANATKELSERLDNLARLYETEATKNGSFRQDTRQRLADINQGVSRLQRGNPDSLGVQRDMYGRIVN